MPENKWQRIDTILGDYLGHTAMQDTLGDGLFSTNKNRKLIKISNSCKTLSPPVMHILLKVVVKIIEHKEKWEELQALEEKVNIMDR